LVEPASAADTLAANVSETDGPTSADADSVLPGDDTSPPEGTVISVSPCLGGVSPKR
jgi:hypothetical protein